MTVRWLVVALAGLALLAAAPAFAKSRHHKVPAHCVDQPANISFWSILTNQPPQPNGCAPPVFVGREFVGQDPDPNIRRSLLRDPDTGYTFRR